MTATELLRADHRKVERLFDMFNAGDLTVVSAITSALKEHDRIELRLVYPTIEQLRGDDGEVNHGEEEHARIRQAVHDVEHAAVNDLKAAMERLHGEVVHHVAEEESKILPMLEASPDHDRSLGAQIESGQ